MKYIINRLLFSLYYWNLCVCNIIDYTLKPTLYIIHKIFYKVDIYGNSKKKHRNFSTYHKHQEKLLKDTAKNLDYGYCSYRSQGEFIGTIMLYLIYFIKLIKHYEIMPLDDISDFKITFISMGVAFFITHILSFQNNLYKKYFKRFKSSKNNAIWHIITLLYVIGSFIAFYKSLFY